MSKTGDHTAAASAIGYLYQCEYALLSLIRSSRLDPNSGIGLEVLDDVHFETEGAPTNLLQVKHHLGENGSISLRSVDLWRTIGAWLSSTASMSGPRPALQLITTQEIGADLLSLTAGDLRDPGDALVKLQTAARENPGNQVTSAARAAFMSMTPSARTEFVGQITITGAAPNSKHLDAEISKELVLSIPGGKTEAFLHQLKGRWHALCLRLLRKETPRVTGNELAILVDQIRNELKVDSLPIDPNIHYVDFVAEDFVNRPFVSQLKLVAMGDDHLWRHIRDFHRAFTQRSLWLRHQLIGHADLDDYERRLKEEWEFAFEEMRDSLTAAASEQAKQKSGRDLLAAMAKSTELRFRSNIEEPWVTRGNLHELADRKSIGWHPEFETRLEELLAPKAVVGGSES